MAKRHTHSASDLQSMFGRLEELVLANSGADPFAEVFKLVIAKLWDERCDKPRRFVYAEDCDSIFRDICCLLREADAAWPGVLLSSAQPTLTPAQLQVCVGVVSDYALSGQSFEVFDGFFEFLVARGLKGAKGQYFTPRYVVEMCVRMLRPQAHETILDPACGSGGFLVHALRYVRTTLAPGGEGALGDFCASRLWGFDIDPRAVQIASALMMISGANPSNMRCLNSLAAPAAQQGWRSGAPARDGFDVILTNPPFAGDVRDPELLDAYELARGRSRIERDVLFLERCVGLLRPGGRLAIVLPHNKFAAPAWGYARLWLLHRARILGVVGLGRNTFLPHTHQKASVLFAQKLPAAPRRTRGYNVFFAVSEKDGKNSRGQSIYRGGPSAAVSSWSHVEHDLEEVVEAFDRFRVKEGVLS